MVKRDEKKDRSLKFASELKFSLEKSDYNKIKASEQNTINDFDQAYSK